VSEPRDPSTDAAPSPEPRLVGERYRLGAIIGRGGMATVHRATDIRLDRQVAVKLLKPEVTADPDLAQRFRREALAATVLRHPNIVACLDTGTDGDQPYLVMELVDGEDLAARLRRGGRLAPWAAARIGLDVARALGVAHVRGIVHRDIKPGNILLAADGRAMVTDFGIARLAMDAEAAAPGTTLGSVHYFSPEQARGVGTTPASDVYGLGLVLYEAVTGERPWSGDTTDAIALARVGKTASDVRERRPEIPTALAMVIARALAPDAADRFPNGGAMATALEPIVAAGDAPASVAPAGDSPLEPRSPDLPAGDAALAAPLRPAGPSASDRTAGPPAPAPAPAPASSVVFRGGARRRGSRQVGAVAAVAAIVAVIGGSLALAAIPSGGDAPERSLPAETDDPIANATAEPPATPEPTPTAEPTAEPTPTEEPTVVPPGEVADLCEPFFDVPCGLGAGRYAPSRFAVPFDVEIGDGWSTLAHAPDVAALTREEGLMTYLAGIVSVDPERDPREAPSDARGMIEAVVTMDGVAASEPAAVTIDGRTGFSTDCSPVDGGRLALFATGSSTYYLEAGRTSRIVALDTPDGVLVLAIESYGDFDLRAILDTADPAAGTMRWR
jgi:tRNA A-37 threonylcarbamoyl transferase component Bud32